MDESRAGKKQSYPAGRSSSHRRGQSSYRIHDPEVVFHELDLKPGNVFLDLGCGEGDYSLQAARVVGEQGQVFAIDLDKENIDALLIRTHEAGIGNLQAAAGDICDPLPNGDNTIDVCFISTVLHCIDLGKEGEHLFSEIRRVLKPGGRLHIIECKKEEMPFGPPLHMRLSPDDLEKHIIAYGFKKAGLVDLGYNYMIKFSLTE